MNPPPNSLVDILRWRAINQPNRLAYRFLMDGEYDEMAITYEDLDRQARLIGALLQVSAKAGDRVLLLFPEGLDFIAAYFGCLYAQMIAIPLPPPHPARLEKSLETTFRIAHDATPAVALLSSSLFNAIKSTKAIGDQFGKMKLLVTDRNDLQDWAEKWQQPLIGEAEIDFLQYTSGSTTSPKGVMVSHRNLLHNMACIEDTFGLTSKSKTVFWLPPYHDMGLIGGILQALYTGCPVTLMSHLLFIQRPIRWLQAITRFQATTSGGPNFAYDLCVRKIKPEQREQLDLSTWEVALNGAEPIFHKTLDQFADYFAPCGFRREAFFPCYGLAEATLLVSGGPGSSRPVMKNLVKSELEQNKAVVAPGGGPDTQTVVCCGQNLERQEIRIVDIETLCPCQPDQIGEVWVSGPSIAKGYWNNPSETASTFGAYLSDNAETPFLRTGDLGFLNGEALYVTGRLKNLIIVDGKNHYPHDIERTVENAHSAILPGGCAVFSIEKDGSERAVVIAEIQYKLVENVADVKNAIRKGVAENHELPVHDIILSLPGSIPRTTSGKKQHFLCKRNYLSNTLKEITLL